MPTSSSFVLGTCLIIAFFSYSANIFFASFIGYKSPFMTGSVAAVATRVSVSVMIAICVLESKLEEEKIECLFLLRVYVSLEMQQLKILKHNSYGEMVS